MDNAKRLVLMDFRVTRHFVDATNNMVVCADEFVSHLGYADYYSKLEKYAEEQGADVLKDEAGNVLYVKGKSDPAKEFGESYVKRWNEYENFDVMQVVEELRSSFVGDVSQDQKTFDVWIRIVARMSGSMTFDDTFHFPQDIEVMKKCISKCFPIKNQSEFDLARVRIEQVIGLKMALLGQEIFVALSDFGLKHRNLRFDGQKYIGLGYVAQLSGAVVEVMDKLSKDLSSDLPREWKTEKATKLLDAAVDCGLLEIAGVKYRWLKSKALYGYFCDKVSRYLDIRPSNERIPWIKFAQLIINHKEIKETARQAVNDYTCKGLNPPENDDLVDSLLR